MNEITPEMEALKSRLKATWMAGDYGTFTRDHTSEGENFVARLALKPGERLLDVACGTGNLAIPAARAGAQVTGADIATNLLAQGRSRAQAAGVTIQFDEGDAEQLPYADASFDTVASLFGAMFAPRPARVATELTRVCRPAGRIALANWTPTGFAGQMFKVIAIHLPPSPLMPSPVLWGDEAIVRQRLDDGIADLQMTKRLFIFRYPFTAPEVVAFYRHYFGPTNRAFAALDADQQVALRLDLEQLWTQHNRAANGTTHVEAEYLEIIAIRQS